MKMYVECCKSKDKDSTYQVLKVDLGYRTATLFEVPKDIISEMIDCKMSDIYKMQVGDTIVVGEIIAKTFNSSKEK